MPWARQRAGCQHRPSPPPSWCECGSDRTGRRRAAKPSAKPQRRPRPSQSSRTPCLEPHTSTKQVNSTFGVPHGGSHGCRYSRQSTSTAPNWRVTE
eukprot:6147938-Alexandrium_andersonii.AAC.1